MPSEPISYTQSDAGAAVGVSERTIMRAVKAGELPVHYVGRRPLILATDLRAWIESAPAERAS